MKKRAKTWAQQKRERIKYVDKQILRFCGLTPYDYFWLVADAGIAYVKSIAGNYRAQERNFLGDNEHFWPWFRNQWHYANEEFIRQMELDKIQENEPIMEATQIAIYQEYAKFQNARLASDDTVKGYELTVSQYIKSMAHGSKKSADQLSKPKAGSSSKSTAKSS